MAEIDLEALKFGELNNIQRNDANSSGDRQRTSTATAIRFATEKAFEINTLADVTSFYGIVVGVREVSRAISEYKDSIVVLQETDTPTAGAEAKNYLYKVYIPELEPLPAPESYQDPVIGLYADVSIAKGMIREQPSQGALVEVTYEDVETLSHPKITQVLAPNGKTSGFSVGESSNSRNSFESGKGKTKVEPTGGDIFYPGDDGTSFLALGASYIHMYSSFAKQLGMDRFALSGKVIEWIKDQIDPAIAEGKLDFSKYTHAFFFTGPNSLVALQSGAKVFKNLIALIEKVRTEGKKHNKDIKMTVVTIQGFANYGLKNYKDATTIKTMRATKDYNKLIEDAEGKTIDYVIKWAQKGTVDYGVTLPKTIDDLDKEELAKFSMPGDKTKYSEAIKPFWTKDLLHPNKAGHAKVKEMIEAKEGLLP